MTTSEQIDRCLRDIRGINEVLDPKGAEWARERKKEREAWEMSKFKTGPSHFMNPVPLNHEEAVQHGNALAMSGNYPVGTSDCFNVGISGGCGPECFVYLEGKCKEHIEMISRLDSEQMETYKSLYGGQPCSD